MIASNGASAVSNGAPALSDEQRYEALACADGDHLEALADRILRTGVAVEVRSGPEPVTAPLRLPVPGAGATTAVVGHVALTTCSVHLDGVRGDGCRGGRELRGAVAAAICDAEVNRGGPLSAEVAALARTALVARADRWRERARRVAVTRLDGGP